MEMSRGREMFIAEHSRLVEATDPRGVGTVVATSASATWPTERNSDSMENPEVSPYEKGMGLTHLRAPILVGLFIALIVGNGCSASPRQVSTEAPARELPTCAGDMVDAGDLRPARDLGVSGGTRFLLGGQPAGHPVLLWLGADGGPSTLPLPSFVFSGVVEAEGLLRIYGRGTDEHMLWMTVDVSEPDAPVLGEPSPIYGMRNQEGAELLASNGDVALMAIPTPFYGAGFRNRTHPLFLGRGLVLLDVETGERIGEPLDLGLIRDLSTFCTDQGCTLLAIPGEEGCAGRPFAAHLSTNAAPARVELSPNQVLSLVTAPLDQGRLVVWLTDQGLAQGRFINADVSTIGPVFTLAEELDLYHDFSITEAPTGMYFAMRRQTRWHLALLGRDGLMVGDSSPLIEGVWAGMEQVASDDRLVLVGSGGVRNVTAMVLEDGASLTPSCRRSLDADPETLIDYSVRLLHRPGRVSAMVEGLRGAVGLTTLVPLVGPE